MPATSLALDQPALPGMCPVTEAVEALAHHSASIDRGAVFTRREVVDFMLDLIGYTADADLHGYRLLEPSMGEGDFLLPAVQRLLQCWSRSSLPSSALDGCIRAVELHHHSYLHTFASVQKLLCEHGLPAQEAARIAGLWLVQGDFLLTALPGEFDFVVGNPPYVRQELIPAALLREYRRKYQTLFDRADLYVPFIERGLRLLHPGGQLAFICADRWTKNRYGGPLRALVADGFHLKAYVDMTDTPAFHADVVAYPAITVIERAAPGPTTVAASPRVEAEALRRLSAAMRGAGDALPAGVHRLHGVVAGSAPWVLHGSATTDLVRRIEGAYPTLEEAGCKVGIGVATGADQVFIGSYDDLDVEPDRKLPLAMTRDIASGVVNWRGQGVINPFTDEGPLVDLAAYPRLHAYLNRHKAAITARHVAQKDAVRWYRTIDRITPALAARPKLLIPDIKGDAQVVFEEGRLYPHHNLYYVVSDVWDLHALQAVLLSDLTRLFVATYSTKMRGGFLRFQAQYLRRIRLPAWDSVSPTMRQQLQDAAIALDIAACNAAVCDLYGLSAAERATLQAQSTHVA